MSPLIALVALTQQHIETPYRQSAKLAIRAVEPTSTTVPRYGMVELKLDLQGTYDNPFDPTDIAVDAKVTPPSGPAYSVPGFLYRGFTRSLAGDDEQLAPDAATGWRVRFSPKLEGEYQIAIVATDRTGSIKTPPIKLTAGPAEKQGFVKLSEKDPRYFTFDAGGSYWPVGANICWGSSRGTYSYDDWLPKYGEQGVNYTRLWLSPGWSTFGMEQSGKPSEGKGLGQIDLGNAWRLDYVLELARKQDIQMMLCIQSYNILRNETDGYPYWLQTPENSDNGGPLRLPTEFWTNAKMERFFKNKLRYLVARYGAYSNTLSWEFWNEVDLTTDFDVEVVRDWHKRMATYLRSIDPYKHLITTSAANTMGFRQLDQLPEIDYAQTHHYGPDPAKTTAEQQSRKGGTKAHFVGEIGADAAGPRKEDDPKGAQIHDPMWSAVGTGASGTAMAWWWDSLIAPNDLYPLFGAVARFVKDVDWPNEGFRQTTPKFVYAAPPVSPPMKDLNISGGPVDWKPSPSTKPVTVFINKDKVTGAKLVAGILHGIKNHPDLHNPVTFRVSLTKPTWFQVDVDNVSGFGGANLRVKLDGKEVIAKDFADTDEANTETMTKYVGPVGVTIPKGDHVIVVENTGADWVMVAYRFVGLLPRTKPPLEGWSIIGDTKVLAWIRLEDRDWKTSTKDKQLPSPPAVFTLSGLASGSWKAEYWDTWEGKVTRSFEVRIPVNGQVRLNLPAITSDLALKLIKT